MDHSAAPRSDHWSELEETPLANRYPYQNVYEMIAHAGRSHGRRPALSFQLKSSPKSPSVTFDYQTYAQEVTRAANLFRSLGAGREDGIGLLLPNLPQTAFALLGAQTAGIAVPINPLLSPEHIAGILRDANAKILVSLAPFPKTDLAEKAAGALALAPEVKTLLEIDLGQYLRPPLRWLIPLLRPKRVGGYAARRMCFDAERASQAGAKLAFSDAPGRESVGAYFHTGGTTGLPKLARHSQQNMLYTSWVSQELLYRPDNIILCALPLFHVFAAYIMTIAPIAAGAHVVQLCPAGFRTEGIMDDFWGLVERWKASFFVGVPTVFAAVRQREVNADVSSLRYALCGSAPLPRELFLKFEQVTGLKILEGYGQTEATCVISCNPPDGERRIGSVGIPLPYTEVRVARTDGNGGQPSFCGAGEVGEIVVRGPNVFGGYVRDALNEGLFADGKWLRTGDLGMLDADGYIWITGRSKDLIIRGGHNIDPGVIEEALAEHPAVAFSAAIGMPDAKAGELPFGFVELIEGGAADPEELKTFAAERVGDAAARPVEVRILDTLPKTVIGKIFKPELRKIVFKEVLDEGLKEAGVSATLEIADDPDLGLVAEVETADQEAAGRVLGGYSVPWRMAGGRE